MHFKKYWINFVFFIKNFKDILLLKKEKEAALLLKEKNLRISLAESCTGGLLSSRLTDVAGSSAYIFKNFVTYSNKSKEELLGINHKTIEKYGVVSYEVSLDMVKGLLNKYYCDIALSITGIAGPDGGSREKPAGLVYISIGSKKSQKTYRFQANSFLDRRLMKYAFSNRALEILISFLKENY